MKTLDHGVGPAITFTRASGATFFDANGVLQTASNDTPRFDHYPVTGESRGLLIEESRVNSLVQSANFSDASWSKVGSRWLISATTVTAPDSTSVALNQPNTSTASCQLVQSVSKAASAQTWTMSFFFKTTTALRYMHVFLDGGTSADRVLSRINLQTATIVTAASAAGTFSAGSTVGPIAAGNGWYRFAVSGTTGSETSVRFNIYYSDSDNTVNSTLSGETFAVWGAQLEAGAFPTSYIPTTTAAATRAADSAVVTPISSFYNESESTLFSESSAISVAADTTVAAINNTTQNEQIDHRYAITGLNTRVRVGGVNQAAFTTGSAPVSGTIYKLAGAYKQNDFAFSVNGSAASTDSLGDMPTGLSQMEIGRRAGSSIITGHIRKLAYWPKRLTDTLLQQLTT